MVKVKICGNRTLDDVQATRDADAQGFIVDASRSPRNLEPREARRLIQSDSLFNTTVLVTTRSDPERLAALADELTPDVLQVHAELSARRLCEIRRRVTGSVRLIGLLPVQEGPLDLIERAQALARAPIDALLLDTQVNGRSGGTGTPHDWERSRAIREVVEPLPVILAGGLTPENVRRAIEIVEPYAVDVSSGVEEDGRKSPAKVNALLREVRCYG